MNNNFSAYRSSIQPDNDQHYKHYNYPLQHWFETWGKLPKSVMRAFDLGNWLFFLLVFKQHFIEHKILSNAVHQLPDVGVMTADGVVETYMPTLAVVVGAQVLVVRVPHDGFHIPQPLLTEVLEQRQQDVHGHRLKCGKRETDNNERKKAKRHQLSDLHACFPVCVVHGGQSQCLHFAVDSLAEMEMTTAVARARKGRSDRRNQATFKVREDGCWIELLAGTSCLLFQDLKYCVVTCSLQRLSLPSDSTLAARACTSSSNMCMVNSCAYSAGQLSNDGSEAQACQILR